jgi:hypothetical protein
MLEIDVSRGEKVILPVENCTGSVLLRDFLDRISGFPDAQDKSRESCKS